MIIGYLVGSGSDKSQVPGSSAVTVAATGWQTRTRKQLLLCKQVTWIVMGTGLVGALC